MVDRTNDKGGGKHKPAETPKKKWEKIQQEDPQGRGGSV